MIFTEPNFPQNVAKVLLAAEKSDDCILTAVTSDGRLSLPRAPLLLLSPFLRSLLSSSPCCSLPSLLLPSHTSASLSSLLAMLSTGSSQRLESPDAAEEVASLARSLGLDTTRYSVLGLQDDKEKPTSGLNSSGLVLDVDDSFGSTNLSQSMVSESEDALDTSYDISADEAGMSDTLPEVLEGSQDVEPEDLTCRICPHTASSPSVLLLHYAQSHYLREIKEGFSDFVNRKTCTICGKESKSTQSLFMHIAVKHEKVGVLLQRDGHPLPKKGRPGRPSEASRPSGRPSETGSSSARPSEAAAPGGSQELACAICGTAHTSPSGLLQHYASSHYLGQIRESCADLVDNKTCTLCGYKAKQMAALFLHIAVKHDKIQVLLERDGHPLPKKGQRSTKQARHQQEEVKLVEGVKEEEGVEVEEVEVEEVEIQEVKEEVSDIKEEADSQFPCTVCGNRQKSSAALIQHTCMHYTRQIKERFSDCMDMATNQCKMCNKVCASKQSIVLHIGVKHHKLQELLEEMKVQKADAVEVPDVPEASKSGDGPFTCELCGKEKKHVSQLWVHYCLAHLQRNLRTEYAQHTDGLICTLCGKTLGSETALYSHIGVKHGKVNDILVQTGYKPLPPCRARTESASVTLE